MFVSLVAAMSENRVIGINSRLPWGSLPDDIKNLHRLADGKKMIMGRKSYDTIDRLWSDAGNIVISRHRDIILDKGFEYAESFEQALDLVGWSKNLDQTTNRLTIQPNKNEVIVLGGGEIFKLAMTYADNIYLTVVHASFQGDTFFPEIDTHIFELTESIFHPIDVLHAFSFTFLTFKRKTNV